MIPTKKIQAGDLVRINKGDIYSSHLINNTGSEFNIIHEVYVDGTITYYRFKNSDGEICGYRSHRFTLVCSASDIGKGGEELVNILSI